MKFTIPPPLGLLSRCIEVLVACPPPDEQFGGLASRGQTCATFLERSAVYADVVTAMSPRWLSWAVSEALANRTPRTRAFLEPSRTGGGAFDLGRGPVARPMIFAGASCHPERDGHMCEQAEPSVLPEHEALLPRSHVVVEDAGDVLFDDFESLDWPAIRAPGGAA